MDGTGRDGWRIEGSTRGPRGPKKHPIEQFSFSIIQCKNYGNLCAFLKVVLDITNLLLLLTPFRLGGSRGEVRVGSYIMGLDLPRPSYFGAQTYPSDLKKCHRDRVCCVHH